MRVPHALQPRLLTREAASSKLPIDWLLPDGLLPNSNGRPSRRQVGTWNGQFSFGIPNCGGGIKTGEPTTSQLITEPGSS
jgi:hypothetical protein